MEAAFAASAFKEGDGCNEEKPVVAKLHSRSGGVPLVDLKKGN